MVVANGNLKEKVNLYRKSSEKAVVNEWNQNIEKETKQREWKVGEEYSDCYVQPLSTFHQQPVMKGFAETILGGSTILFKLDDHEECK